MIDGSDRWKNVTIVVARVVGIIVGIWILSHIGEGYGIASAQSTEIVLEHPSNTNYPPWLVAIVPNTSNLFFGLLCICMAYYFWTVYYVPARVKELAEEAGVE
jgi:hypothetical protein